jgi:triacylglycerol lipase
MARGGPIHPQVGESAAASPVSGRSGATVTGVTLSTLADFLRPEGYDRPLARAVLGEGRVVGEAGRYALAAVGQRGRRPPPYSMRAVARVDDPVLLVPGFMAGDGSLGLMRRALVQQGFRAYRSQIHANVGCTLDAAAQLELRL